MRPGGEQRGGPAPAQVVPVGVEEPGAVPAAGAEHEAGGGEQEAGHQVQRGHGRQHRRPEPEPDGPRRAPHRGHGEDAGEAAEHEAEGEEALHGQQPRRHQPLPDLAVGVAPGGVAAVEQVVELQTGKPESVEAHLNTRVRT